MKKLLLVLFLLLPAVAFSGTQDSASHAEREDIFPIKRPGDGQYYHVSIDQLIALLEKADVGLGNIDDVKHNFGAGGEPTATDDAAGGYAQGSLWTKTDGSIWICQSSSIGAAVWGQASGGGDSAWGGITGTLSSQADLQAVLDAKLSSETDPVATAAISALTPGAIGAATAPQGALADSALQPGDVTDTDDQTIGLAGTTLSIESGNSVDLSAVQDGIGTDSQTLSLSGSDLTISDGNTITLPAGTGAVDSVAGKTGVVTLDTGDISGLGTVAPLDTGNNIGDVVVWQDDGSSNASLPIGGMVLSAGANALSDDTYSGLALGGRNAGEAISMWDVVYFDTTDSEYKHADAELPARGIAVSSGTDASELVVLVQGVVRNDGWAWTTVGGPLYLSDTAGGLTETAPSTSGDCVQIVGWVLSDDEAYLNFSGHYLEVE